MLKIKDNLLLISEISSVGGFQTGDTTRQFQPVLLPDIQCHNCTVSLFLTAAYQANFETFGA